MLKHRAIAAVAVVSIFGISACGGSSVDQKNDTSTTLRQKNGRPKSPPSIAPPASK